MTIEERVERLEIQTTIRERENITIAELYRWADNRRLATLAETIRLFDGGHR